jgi:hypothetical protein
MWRVEREREVALSLSALPSLSRRCISCAPGRDGAAPHPRGAAGAAARVLCGCGTRCRAVPQARGARAAHPRLPAAPPRTPSGRNRPRVSDGGLGDAGRAAPRPPPLPLLLPSCPPSPPPPPSLSCQARGTGSGGMTAAGVVERAAPFPRRLLAVSNAAAGASAAARLSARCGCSRLRLLLPLLAPASTFDQWSKVVKVVKVVKGLLAPAPHPAPVLLPHPLPASTTPAPRPPPARPLLAPAAGPGVRQRRGGPGRGWW